MWCAGAAARPPPPAARRATIGRGAPRPAARRLAIGRGARLKGAANGCERQRPGRGRVDWVRWASRQPRAGRLRVCGRPGRPGLLAEDRQGAAGGVRGLCLLGATAVTLSLSALAPKWLRPELTGAPGGRGREAVLPRPLRAAAAAFAGPRPGKGEVGLAAWRRRQGCGRAGPS